MQDRAPSPLDEPVTLRPATWRNASWWLDVRNDLVLVALVTALALATSSPDEARRTGALLLLAVVVLLVMGWIRSSCERLVVHAEVVELRRWPRFRGVVRLARDDQLWASRCLRTSLTGHEVGRPALALSDGHHGVLLDGPGWPDRIDEVLAALDLQARRIPRSDAVRSHPAAFSWPDRHPWVATTLWGIGMIGVFLVLTFAT